MPTTVTRVPERVHQEVLAAARVTGRNTSDLFEEAWQHYKTTPLFERTLRDAQAALASGNIETVTDLIIEQAARNKALSIRQSRSEQA